MFKNTKKMAGFSLIEIMIVIALIAILVSLALPSYKQYTKKAYYLEIIQAAAPLKLAVAECYQTEENLSLCSSGKYGIPKGEAQGLVKSAVVNQGGVIHIIPHNLHGISSDEDFYLTPKVTKKGLTWQTSGGGVSVGYSR